METYFNLGLWRRSITTPSAQAQLWFDRGLNWTYAFNQEEAVRCFSTALDFDADCAMAYWGIAYAAGPFYNRPWVRFTPTEVEQTVQVCFDAAQAAFSRREENTPSERALIEAIVLKYQSRTAVCLRDLNCWHDEFVDAMRGVHQRFPRDLDVTTLFVESAITRTPRQLWDLSTGAPAPGADTLEGQAILEEAMGAPALAGQRHPGILHMYIHLMEMSRTPEKALSAADRLRDLCPDAGHLQHMPAHIYVLCGDYAQSILLSEKAVAADDKFLEYAGDKGFYTTARCHDLHLYMYAAMFQGHLADARFSADRLTEIATPALVEQSFPYMGAILDGLSAMRTHVLVRFGQWQELIDQPGPNRPDIFPIGAAMHAYGRGIAYASLGQVLNAQVVRDEFAKLAELIPADHVALSNRTRDVLAVGQAMLEGELAYRRGDYAAAFDALRLAVQRDDSLNYTEPWAWMHPPRHALGALLLEQGHYDEAEAVYRADLGYSQNVPRCVQHPDNVWGLHGLLECVERRGNSTEADVLRQRLTLAMARTDVPIHSSCYCKGAQRAKPI